jgi:hypothetical protein
MVFVHLRTAYIETTPLRHSSSDFLVDYRLDKERDCEELTLGPPDAPLWALVQWYLFASVHAEILLARSDPRGASTVLNIRGLDIRVGLLHCQDVGYEECVAYKFPPYIRVLVVGCHLLLRDMFHG